MAILTLGANWTESANAVLLGLFPEGISEILSKSIRPYKEMCDCVLFLIQLLICAYK